MTVDESQEARRIEHGSGNLDGSHQPLLARDGVTLLPDDLQVTIELPAIGHGVPREGGEFRLVQDPRDLHRRQKRQDRLAACAGMERERFACLQRVAQGLGAFGDRVDHGVAFLGQIGR